MFWLIVGVVLVVILLGAYLGDRRRRRIDGAASVDADLFHDSTRIDVGKGEYYSGGKGGL